MIVDRSALLGVLFAEPGRQRYPEAVGGRLRRGGEPGRHGSRADRGRRLDDLVRFSGVAIEPVTAEQARLARRAYRTYGRGSGSPARLNLGDCFAYALAKAASEPLLFKGEDFPHTDIEPALAPWGWPSIGRRRVRAWVRSFSAGALPSSPSVQRNGSTIVSPVALATVLHVLGQQRIAAGLERGGDDQGIVEAEATIAGEPACQLVCRDRRSRRRSPASRRSGRLVRKAQGS